MKDWCVNCQNKNYQDNSGKWIEFEDMEGLRITTERFVCSGCLEKLGG